MGSWLPHIVRIAPFRGISPALSSVGANHPPERSAAMKASPVCNNLSPTVTFASDVGCPPDSGSTGFSEFMAGTECWFHAIPSHQQALAKFPITTAGSGQPGIAFEVRRHVEDPVKEAALKFLADDRTPRLRATQRPRTVSRGGFDDHFSKPLAFPKLTEAIRAGCFA